MTTHTIEPQPWLTPLAEANTPEWLEARRQGITASEAAAAAGISEWRTPLEVFLSKRQEVPPLEPNDAMRLGHLLEPIVQSEFCRKSGLTVERSPVGLLQHVSEPFVLATPDAILIGSGGLELGEWKTTTGHYAARFGDEDTDDVPIDWLCQVQQQMAVCGIGVANIGVLVDGRALKTFRVLRDDELIEVLIQCEAELWQRIQNNDPPPADWEHESTPRLVKQLYRDLEPSSVVELTRELAGKWEEYQKIGERIKAYEQLRDSLKAQVLYAMGDAEAGLLPDSEFMVRRKRVEATTVSYERGAYVDVRCVKRPRRR